MGEVTIHYLMTTFYVFQLLFAFSLATAATIETSPLSEGELNSLSFADDSAPPLGRINTHRFIGAASADIYKGYGVSYNHPFANKHSVWGSIAYAPNSLPTMTSDYSSPTGEIREEEAAWTIRSGIDGTFNPFRRKYWLWLAGLGVGLKSSRHNVTTYEQECWNENICSIRNPRHDSFLDRYFFHLREIWITRSDRTSIN